MITYSGSAPRRRTKGLPLALPANSALSGQKKARFMVRVSSRLDSRVSKFVYVHSEQFDLAGAN
jgi:hypothetical protein